MQAEGDILELLRAEGAEAARKAQRALIVQPGAIGDCLLTLPLVAFLKETLSLGRVDILGHTEYTGILPGRTCVNSVISIDSLELHRLCVEPKAYNPPDRDPLIHAFAGYAWIITFLGEPGSNFEQNLIFTANCSHTSEVITLALKPPKDFSGHVADYYIQQFINQSNLSLEIQTLKTQGSLIRAMKTDVKKGWELLEEIAIDPCEEVIIIHPGSGSHNKCWHLDNFLAVAKQFLSKGAEVIFLLGPAEIERFTDAKVKKLTSVAKCLTHLSLSEVLSLLSCANGFIGNDSGISHLASMLGVKTLTIFGPTNSDVYKPIGPAVKVFVNNTKSFATRPSANSQRKLLDIFY